MDITVIVVTYNQQDTIARTLDSILSQRFSGSFEILIGDDCSTDGTRIVCEEYSNRYPDKIRYIRRERNLGVVLNYFDCIENARGRYLADCAGDDFWVDPDKLQREYQLLESRPDVTMVTTDWLECDPDGKNRRRSPMQLEVTEEKVYEKGELCEPLVAQQVMPHLCTALYRRSSIMKWLEKERSLMVDPSYGCEDLQIMIALSMEGKVVTLPGVTLCYSVGGDSISNRKDMNRRLDYGFSCLRQEFRLCDRFNIVGSLVQKDLHRKLNYFYWLVFKSGSRAMRDTLVALVRERGIRLRTKTRLYHFLTKNGSIWKLTRAIYRLSGR